MDFGKPFPSVRNHAAMIEFREPKFAFFDQSQRRCKCNILFWACTEKFVEEPTDRKN